MHCPIIQGRTNKTCEAGSHALDFDEHQARPTGATKRASPCFSWASSAPDFLNFRATTVNLTTSEQARKKKYPGMFRRKSQFQIRTNKPQPIPIHTLRAASRDGCHIRARRSRAKSVSDCCVPFPIPYKLLQRSRQQSSHQPRCFPRKSFIDA